MGLDYEFMNKELKKIGWDFDVMKDGFGNPIDEKIKPLLYVLHFCCFNSYSSCEGHPMAELRKKSTGKILEKDAYHFIEEHDYEGERLYLLASSAPWVEFTHQQNLGILENIIGQYNIDAHIMWKYQKGIKLVTISPDYAHPIEDLHRNIKEFAEFVHEKFLERFRVGNV